MTINQRYDIKVIFTATSYLENTHIRKEVSKNIVHLINLSHFSGSPLILRAISGSLTDNLRNMSIITLLERYV